MMKTNFWSIAALSMCAVCAACENDENTVEDAVNAGNNVDGSAASAYVVAGTTGDAAYLITAETLDNGLVSSVGNGFETENTSATTWVFYGNKYLYRVAYNRGAAGTTASFCLGADGKIQARPKEYNILNYTTYGIYRNEIITAAAAETAQKDAYGNSAYGINFSIMDVDAETTRTQTIIAEDFLHNKEYVTFSGLLEANGKIYTAVVPLGCSPYGVAAGGVLPGNEDLVQNAGGGTGGGTYTSGTLSGTQYPNECWVAIFDDDSFTHPTLVKTDSLSYAAGRMRSAYYQTIWAADNGDIYVFSPSYAKSNSDTRQTTDRPSGVMRIKAGATEFDSSYPRFNIEEVAGGNQVYRCWHISGDYFLLQMYTQGLNIKGTGATRLAVYKGEERTFTYVTGLPDADVISSFSKDPYCEDGMCYTTVVTTDGAKPTVYKIDPATAHATAGLQVEADAIGALGLLKSN